MSKSRQEKKVIIFYAHNALLPPPIQQLYTFLHREELEEPPPLGDAQLVINRAQRIHLVFLFLAHKWLLRVPIALCRGAKQRRCDMLTGIEPCDRSRGRQRRLGRPGTHDRVERGGINARDGPEFVRVELDTGVGEEALANHPPERNLRECVACVVRNRSTTDVCIIFF